MQVCYQEARAPLPKWHGAEYVNDDEMCATCHGAYAKSFAANNVHRRRRLRILSRARPARTWRPAARNRG